MKERPILFSAPMVRALLAGTKTQTRRILKPQPSANNPILAVTIDGALQNPYGQPGDRLWVRESWGFTRQDDDLGDGDVVAYKAGEPWLVWEASNGHRRLRRCQSGEIMRPNHYCSVPNRWTPSIHMPRWASRITLEITAVRVQALHDITEHDARAEGITLSQRIDEHEFIAVDPVTGYRWLWEQINGPGSWDLNPWVWAITFKRVTP